MSQPLHARPPSRPDSVASMRRRSAPVSFAIRSSAGIADVADEHVVVARVHQEPGDHAANFAGAEQQNAMHRSDGEVRVVTRSGDAGYVRVIRRLLRLTTAVPALRSYVTV